VRDVVLRAPSNGVVSLVSSEYEGRRLRVLTIEKLRGQQIQQHR